MIFFPFLSVTSYLFSLLFYMFYATVLRFNLFRGELNNEKKLYAFRIVPCNFAYEISSFMKYFVQLCISLCDVYLPLMHFMCLSVKSINKNKINKTKELSIQKRKKIKLLM